VRAADGSPSASMTEQLFAKLAESSREACPPPPDARLCNRHGINGWEGGETSDGRTGRPAESARPRCPSPTAPGLSPRPPNPPRPLVTTALASPPRHTPDDTYSKSRSGGELTRLQTVSPLVAPRPSSSAPTSLAPSRVCDGPAVLRAVLRSALTARSQAQRRLIVPRATGHHATA
jgi:hypothetical protein